MVLVYAAGAAIALFLVAPFVVDLYHWWDLTRQRPARALRKWKKRKKIAG